MGFATIGYPTRHHKRRRLPDHDDRPIYYHNHKKRTVPKQNKERTPDYLSQSNDINNGITSSVSQNGIRPKNITLQDLPYEIIQRIFVLVKDTTCMPKLNKFFYTCLRPTEYLVRKAMIERYFFDPKRYGIERCLQDNGYLINPEIFSNKLFTQYLLRNLKSLPLPIDLFAPRSLIPYLHDDNLPQDFVFDIGQLSKGEFDLPTYFYHNFDCYCHKPSLLQTMCKYFTVSNIPLILENFLEWALTEGSHYGITNIIEVLEAIWVLLSSRNIFVNTQHLMIITLHRLYDKTDDNSIRYWKDLFHDSEEIIDDQKERFVEYIVRAFYRRNDDSGTKLLSGTDIWNILMGISNMKLIGIFTKYGVYPEMSMIGNSSI